MATAPDHTYDDILYSMYLERIERGVHYLNKTYTGWVDDINLKTFDIARPDLCVLGQVALANGETFVLAALRAVGGTVGNPESFFAAVDFTVEHGFASVGISAFEATEAWRHKIHQLRQERILVA